MGQSTTLILRLTLQTKARLDRLAKMTQRSQSCLASEAVQNYLGRSEWQIKEIKAAIKEADAGEFASDKQVKAVFQKWGVDVD